jgi:hypothetical protein
MINNKRNVIIPELSIQAPPAESLSWLDISQEELPLKKRHHERDSIQVKKLPGPGRRDDPLMATGELVRESALTYEGMAEITRVGESQEK